LERGCCQRLVNIFTQYDTCCAGRWQEIPLAVKEFANLEKKLATMSHPCESKKSTHFSTNALHD